jgi:hypothetical protein
MSFPAGAVKVTVFGPPVVSILPESRPSQTCCPSRGSAEAVGALSTTRPDAMMTVPNAATIAPVRWRQVKRPDTFDVLLNWIHPLFGYSRM